jgi:molybdenum ABC transporter molybdate-binding protein
MTASAALSRRWTLLRDPRVPLAMLALAGLAIIGMLERSRPATPSQELLVYCAAGLKPSVEAAAKHFEQEGFGAVRLQFGGSGQLLESLALTGRGDLFIAADASYVDQAQQRGLARERFGLAMQRPALAVAAGNPKHIRSFSDALRADVRLGLANPETASIGRCAKRALTEIGRWDEVHERVVVMKPTVNEIADDVRIGALDAAVVWDATIAQVQGLERVPAPELGDHGETVTATVLAKSAHPTAAIRFARYLAAPDRGSIEFVARGYEAAAGDRWSPRPSLTLFSGSVNRAAIVTLVKQFSEREGADIDTNYNGCGILCASMKAAAEAGHGLPDAYYACDICFVPPVASIYPEAVMLTETPIVIAVAKGNPKNIKTLVDLAQPGLRVGLANAEQASLGYITRRMLERTGLWESVLRNSSAQVPGGEMLANQLLTGSLDAAIVYRTNVLTHGDRLEVIAINNPAAKAVQPFAIAKDSPNHQLASRLLAWLQANRPSFTDVGFAWREDQRPMVSAGLPPIGGDLDQAPRVDGGGGNAR